MPFFSAAPLWTIRSVLTAIAMLILAGACNSAVALLLGIMAALLFPAISLQPLHRWSGLLLKCAIVLLGFNLPLFEIWHTAQQTWLASIVTITVALSLGWLLTRTLKLERDTGILLTVGTAICGGSAIAAMAPVIRARSQAIIIAISTVFLLNAVALFVFPYLGTWLELTPQQFGVWSALAIHDTSSVVGAATAFAPDAVNTATTAKLVRSLWIIPLVIVMAAIEHRRNRISWPWFILLFVVASVVRTMFPGINGFSHAITPFAHQLFALALFGIGCQFSRSTLQQVRWQPLTMAITLWLVLTCISYVWVTQ